MIYEGHPRKATCALNHSSYLLIRRYQRDNQKRHIEEEQTTPWPKEKVEKDKTTIYKAYI